MNVDYFIKKFRSIPEALWTTDTLYNGWTHQKCASGHCDSIEYSCLRLLFAAGGFAIASINDGPAFGQPTPKQRILAALEYIKSL